MIQVVLIAAGYASLIYVSGWIGAVAAGVHVLVLCLASSLHRPRD